MVVVLVLVAVVGAGSWSMVVMMNKRSLGS
jgi:hypothetical protein